MPHVFVAIGWGAKKNDPTDGNLHKDVEDV
jgi:hypothetical protein